MIGRTIFKKFIATKNLQFLTVFFLKKKRFFITKTVHNQENIVFFSNFFKKYNNL